MGCERRHSLCDYITDSPHLVEERVDRRLGRRVEPLEVARGQQERAREHERDERDGEQQRERGRRRDGDGVEREQRRDEPDREVAEVARDHAVDLRRHVARRRDGRRVGGARGGGDGTMMR